MSSTRSTTSATRGPDRPSGQWQTVLCGAGCARMSGSGAASAIPANHRRSPDTPGHLCTISLLQSGVLVTCMWTWWDHFRLPRGTPTFSRSSIVSPGGQKQFPLSTPLPPPASGQCSASGYPDLGSRTASSQTGGHNSRGPSGRSSTRPWESSITPPRRTTRRPMVWWSSSTAISKGSQSATAGPGLDGRTARRHARHQVILEGGCRHHPGPADLRHCPQVARRDGPGHDAAPGRRFQFSLRTPERHAGSGPAPGPPSL